MNYVSPQLNVEAAQLLAADDQMIPSLLRVLRGIFRRRKIGLAVAGAIFALVVGAALLQPTKYSATSLVMISPGKARVVSAEQSLTEDRTDSGAVETAIEILRSPYLAARTVAALRLDADPNWNPKARKRAAGAALSAAPAANDTAETSIPVQRLLAATSVHRRSLSFVIEVSVMAPTAAQAAEIANAMVRQYQIGREEMRANALLLADGWLTNRMKELRTELQQKEAAIEAFRAERGMLTTGVTSLNEMQISNIQASVLSARAELAEKEARSKQIAGVVKRGGSTDTMGTALISDTMKELRAREADLTRRQADLESRYTDRHPNVLSGRAELGEIRARIAAELSRLSTNASNEVEVARSRLALLEGSLAESSGKMVAENVSLLHVRELERDAAASRAVYESFLKRYQEIADQGKLDPTEAVVVSKAMPPATRTGPKLSMAFLIAIALAGICGAGAALLYDYFMDSIGDSDEMQQRLGVPVVASLPFVPASTLRLLDPSDRSLGGYVVEKRLTRFAEAFRMLRSTLMFATLDSRSRSVAITSPLPDVGKSTTAICLTRVGAMAGQRAILVDCDLRNPCVLDTFQIAPKQGLREVLAGAAKWRDVVGADERTGAHVLPAAISSDPIAGDLFNGKAMKVLLDELAEEYDLVVLNLPPIMLVADALALAPQADQVLLIGNWQTTSVGDLKSTIAHLSRAGATMLGVVINGVDLRSWRAQRRDQRYYPAEPRWTLPLPAVFGAKADNGEGKVETFT